jgi:hypothetical protein
MTIVRRRWTAAEDDLVLECDVEKRTNNRATKLQAAGRIGPWLAARLRWIPAIRQVASGVLSESTCSSRFDASQVAVSLRETSV